MMSSMLFALLFAIFFIITHPVSAFVIIKPRLPSHLCSDWSNFGVLENDDDDDAIDGREYAKEEDTQEMKAQVGASLDAPSIDDGTAGIEPLFITAGSQLSMDEETVIRVLNACR